MNSKKVYAGLIKLIVFMALLVCLIVLVFNLAGMLAQDGSALAAMTLSSAYTSPTPAPTPTPTPSPTPEMTPLPEFNPKAGPNANPAPVIYSTAILKDGQLLDSYQADEAHTMDFGAPEDYTEAKGIITFRGNNFRTTAQYGETVITQRNFGNFWRHGTSGLSDSGGSYWGGSGWTGQPLIVEWPRETRQIMNMYDWAKEKDGLVEVIYATLDGHVYFMDLETGEDTRDSIFLGYSFKGAGALDPRGYPLMYVGGGLVNGSGSSPRFMVVSLIDGEILYSEGANDSFAPRSWSAFDSSALVDAETDQLIYPGENGVIYIVKLNTNFDPQAGTISIDPEEIKFTFKSSTADKFYYGMEDSAIAWRGHLIIADNGADFVCIDLNTLEIKWRFDCLDDTNCTAVMELDETGHPYVYLSTSFHLGWRSSDTAVIPVWKIDAVTGEEV